MPKLVWNTLNDRRYDLGVDRGVFYPANRHGLVWNGLVSVQESPSDTGQKTRYVDGVKTRSGRGPESFSGTIEAFTYPEEFYEHALIPRHPSAFGLSYRTKTESSYKIHLVYNIFLEPTSHAYEHDTVDPFSWDFTTLPMHIPNARPSAHLIIEAETTDPDTLIAIEDVLYGSLYYSARLPAPHEVLDIFEQPFI